MDMYRSPRRPVGETDANELAGMPLTNWRGHDQNLLIAVHNSCAIRCSGVMARTSSKSNDPASDARTRKTRTGQQRRKLFI